VREHAVDGAVVDIYLHGATSFPICEQLKKRDIPFFFVTGYDRSYQVPDAFKTAAVAAEADRRPRIRARADTRPAGAPVFDGTRQCQPGPARDGRLAGAAAASRTRCRWSAGAVLVSAGSEVSHVHFPITALASISARNVGGKAVEVALGRARWNGPASA
jgi:CheY-like chemotaxis protein